MKLATRYSAPLVLLLVVSLALVTPAMAQVVPSGTILKFVLDDELSTKKNEVGDKFTAQLAAPVVIEGDTLLPAGTIVEGSITKLEKAKRLAGLQGKASLVLAFDRIRTPSREVPVAATLVGVHDPIDKTKQREELEEAKKRDDRVKDEGEIEAKRDVKDIATKGAIGVAAGTVLGALFGNVSRGLLLGSIGGAVAILAPKGNEVTLREGTGFEVRLERDLAVR
jgi:outer membrane lipoprotein SlyB